jgi:hypothetical protein
VGDAVRAGADALRIALCYGQAISALSRPSEAS